MIAAGMALLVLAAVVAVGPSPRAALSRITGGGQRNTAGGRAGLVLALVATVAIGVFSGHPGWVAAAATAMAAGVWLFRQARSARRIAAARRETSRAASSLALLLRTGMIPGAAIQEAADACESLKPAAAAGRLGADVPTALADVARTPGHEGFATLAAAWRVSVDTGAPVAPILHRVAEALRQEDQVRAVVDAELAAARTSSRIMAILPFVALLLGTLMGAEPLAFLGSHWLGEVLVFAGVALGVGGVVWTERLARAVDP